MKLGDIRQEVPSVDSELMLDDRSPRRCVVIYIHPDWRFYTVEFTTALGWKFRETYYFADKTPGGPPLPEEIWRERRMPQFPSQKRGTRWERSTAADTALPIYSTMR